jgi:hypothetical protein
LNSSKAFDFSDQNTYKIYRLTINKEKKFASNFFSKICQTTAIIIFLIKDALEFIGVLIDKKNPSEGKVYKLAKVVVENNKNLLSKIN